MEAERHVEEEPHGPEHALFLRGEVDEMDEEKGEIEERDDPEELIVQCHAPFPSISRILP